MPDKYQFLFKKQRINLNNPYLKALKETAQIKNRLHKTKISHEMMKINCWVDSNKMRKGFPKSKYVKRQVKKKKPPKSVPEPKIPNSIIKAYNYHNKGGLMEFVEEFCK